MSKISDLPAAQSLQGNELVPVLQNGVLMNVKVTDLAGTNNPWSLPVLATAGTDGLIAVMTPGGTPYWVPLSALAISSGAIGGGNRVLDRNGNAIRNRDGSYLSHR